MQTVLVSTKTDLKFGQDVDVGNAGYDLRANEACTLMPGERKVIKTDIRVEMPCTMVAKIESRSGLAVKGIDVRGGVIDSNYRGILGVILHNTTTSYEFVISVGDRIAQLLFYPILHPRIEIISTTTELSETKRGDGGFGSTGMT